MKYNIPEVMTAIRYYLIPALDLDAAEVGASGDNIYYKGRLVASKADLEMREGMLVDKVIAFLRDRLRLADDPKLEPPSEETKLDKIFSRIDDLEASIEHLQEQVQELTP